MEESNRITVELFTVQQKTRPITLFTCQIERKEKEYQHFFTFKSPKACYSQTTQLVVDHKYL